MYIARGADTNGSGGGAQSPFDYFTSGEFYGEILSYEILSLKFSMYEYVFIRVSSMFI